ncbi:MAG: MoaD/ThiS family protein [Candidatus Limnocylindrales bacterium]
MTTVRVPPVLRPATGGLKQVEVGGDTVGEAIAGLTAAYPALATQLLDAQGGLNRFVNVYLNDTDVRHLDELATPVGERDTLVLLPAMAGGAEEDRAGSGLRGSGGEPSCLCTGACGSRVDCACPGRASEG